MKIGFNSVACPAWDLNSIVTNAREMGFGGVELRAIAGECDLPSVPELARDADAVRSLFAKNGIDLVCLGSAVTLDSTDAKIVAAQKARLTDYVELAGRLGCPFVRLYIGEVQRWDNQRRALARIAAAVSSCAQVAARAGVTLLVENGSDLGTSQDMWFVIDAVNHPAVRTCWNQCNALINLERATNSLPRMGGRIGMVHVCDAIFDELGVLLDYVPLGEGGAEVARQVELLKGMAYDGYLMFEWPRMWFDSLADPMVALPKAVSFLRSCVDAKQTVLSAYKNDKYAPRLPSLGAQAANPS